MSQIAVCFIVHDDTYYLAQSIASFAQAGPVFVFVSRIPWHDQPGNWEAAARIAQDAGAEVVLGEWESELAHRQAALQFLLGKGYSHALIPDGDEIVEPGLLEHLLKTAQADLADRVYVHWDTFWKSPEYVIRPREAFTPLLLANLAAAVPVGGRRFTGGRGLLLTPDFGLVHHLSYVGPNARIQRKISTWGHRDEVVPRWYENVWLPWDEDRRMRCLHPTHPAAYGFAECIRVPEILLPALERYRELAGDEDLRPAPVAAPARWPRVSVIIPVYGGRDDLRACLDSLEACRDLLHEVIVVDNASPDDAAEEAASRPLVRLLRNETNEGFAAACNRGAGEAEGDVLLFLNSDTVVPRAGLIRLVEALQRSGSIAAAGPYSNTVGHFQQIDPTYTSLDTLDLFAEDFAQRSAEDVDTDMLVGFCLAVRKSVWEEVGGFDEGFGLGTFEDNDLCYRMRRAGYRLVIAARSFVHHAGSKTLARLDTDVGALLDRNAARYRAKWKEDLDSGFASTLSGLTAERIVFAPEKHPDIRRRAVSDKARRADISLCMIVRDEQRVLGDCLKSARPFFSEMIVVDTGSKDRTREIAQEHGAHVFDFPWTDSFAEARNESLRHAKGRWLFWMDADDTLPWASGEALLDAALQAPEEVIGFVVPVQFVDDGSSASGTRVDHVKLFRNQPGLQFEGRIHEQILSSLRATGCSVARCGAFVLHSGYDTSPEGQAKKRARDARLLSLDLAERPDHPFVLFNLGMTDHYGGEHESAVTWFRKCLEVSGPEESHVRKVYALSALSLRALGRTEECLTTLENGLAITPEDPELHFYTAHTLTALGRYAEAKSHYEQVLQADLSGAFTSVDTGILGYKTFHNLGGLCMLMGDFAQAKAWWRQAMDAAPRFLPSVLELFGAALDHQDFATAQQMVDRVYAIEGASESWAMIGKQYAEALGGPSGGIAFLDRAVNSHASFLGPRLVLARNLLQSGREIEARPHLLTLAQNGVAEAAFFLGVSFIRGGDLATALTWMEKALALNPGHRSTVEQIQYLHQALGITEAPTVAAVSLREACEQLARDLDIEAEALFRFALEDTVGGYVTPDSETPNRRWPGGSVWEVEGQLLYALVRSTRPRVLVEIGSLIGCSTSHLAQACRQNGQGIVYAVDPNLDFSQVSPDLVPYIRPVQEDVFTWSPAEEVDFIFEDGAHAPGFTGKALAKVLPHVRPEGLVLCHDIHQAQFGAHIAAEFQEALSDTVHSVLVAPSNCGLGYARKAGKLDGC